MKTETTFTTARPLLLDNLKRHQSGIIGGWLELVFPGLETAWTYLGEQVGSGKLPAKAGGIVSTAGYPKHGVYPHTPNPARDPILKKFCDQAGWDAGRLDEEPTSSDDDDDMYDSDGRSINSDDRYERRRANQVEREDASNEDITSLQDWVKVSTQ
jgi:hypothetical protein